MDKSLTDLSEFLRYLACNHGDGERLPALVDLSRQLGISVATLREQMEVARALGLVEVRPKTGIRRLPYTFKPAVIQSLAYATAVDMPGYFKAYADLRNHIETAYWHEAVQRLTAEDHVLLRGLVASALAKLAGHPVQIPHEEHRALHLAMYRRLDNPFVIGILETYWEVYVAVGLNAYTDYTYLQNVWAYHQRMVEAVCSGNFSEGYHALVEHTDLIAQRPHRVQNSPRHFE